MSVVIAFSAATFVAGVTTTFSSCSSSVLVKGDIAQPEVLVAINSTITNMGDDRYVKKTIGPYGEQADTNTVLELMWDAAEDKRSTDPMDLYHPDFERMLLENDTNGDMIPDSNVTPL